jgi:ribosomal protein S18 acetylase RimI-like enzyme
VRAAEVARVGEADLADLVPLMLAYCEFYETAQDPAALERLARTLLADPEREGVQLIARDGTGHAVGFATVYWTWSTTHAARLGVMNDLYVAPEGRGTGTAEALMRGCVEAARARGACGLDWVTAPDNLRAQAVYDRFGGVREAWVNYGVSL